MAVPAIFCPYIFSVWVPANFCVNLSYHRALLHFLDANKFSSKDEFVQNYKNLSSFNEIEVLFSIDCTELFG